MKSVRRSGTGSEILVRRALTALGIRYRCNVRDLPGSPDLANKRLRLTIFVNGCFWHRHLDCARATMPKTNLEFWRKKFHENIQRDERNIASLKSMGYKVIVVWECEASSVERVKDILRFHLP